MPTSSSFFNHQITYINRVIIADTQFFVSEILQTLNQQGMSFPMFLESWIKKMEYITSRESLRINLIAIYTLLPHFT
jgi:parvulin-like peptidyl-prolyl isomerase